MSLSSSALDAKARLLNGRLASMPAVHLRNAPSDLLFETAPPTGPAVGIPGAEIMIATKTEANSHAGGPSGDPAWEEII